MNSETTEVFSEAASPRHDTSTSGSNSIFGLHDDARLIVSMLSVEGIDEVKAELERNLSI